MDLGRPWVFGASRGGEKLDGATLVVVLLAIGPLDLGACLTLRYLLRHTNTPATY